MRENFSKVDVLKFLEGTCVEIFSIRVRVFFLQYVRNFSRAPFYECEGWISWSGSTGFHLRISTTFFTGFWGLLSVDQQSGWVEYSQFLFKGPSLLNSKVQNSTCCKTDPQWSQCGLPFNSIFEWTPQTPNPFTPTPIVPCAQFFNGIISLSRPMYFLSLHKFTN